VKKYRWKKTMDKIYRDPTLDLNLEKDSNNIEGLLLFSYFLKICRVILMIVNLSYLIGVLWILLCEAIMDFKYDIDI
jgi:hypothetical protein